MPRTMTKGWDYATNCDTNCQHFWQTFARDPLESTGGIVSYSGILHPFSRDKNLRTRSDVAVAPLSLRLQQVARRRQPGRLPYRTSSCFRAGGVPLLPNTGLPSLNSAAGFGFGGMLAVLEPFTFFLSSSFFLFSASNALTAAACCVFSSCKFDPVLAIDSVKVASWPGNSLSSSSALPVIESGVVSAVFSSELPSTTSLRGMIFTLSSPWPTSEMVIMTARCLSSGINSVNTVLTLLPSLNVGIGPRNQLEPSAIPNAMLHGSGYNPGRYEPRRPQHDASEGSPGDRNLEDSTARDGNRRASGRAVLRRPHRAG